MITNNILEIEYAIKENNIKNIKKILKKNPEEINKIEIHRFIDMIHFNEFDLFDNILKSINSKLKKNLLSNNIIIIKLLKSNNINFINKTKYDLKSLISKSIKKLINTKYTFIDHIRNYANYLNNKMMELLLEYNIQNKYINNIELSQENIINILNHISLNLKQLNY